MPAAFIGHGNPMNTLLHNSYTDAWQAFAAGIERPRAILAVSAHWYINATAVTAMDRPRTIHDFFGFPDELFAYEYAAPGSPELAAEVAEVVKPMWVGQDIDSWGLDHGTWSVLAHMFPDADIPVVQLSVDASKPAEHHLELGARLAPLRDSGVLIVGSGNVVHNLGEVVWGMDDQGFDWARRFDDDAADLMRTAPGDITRLASHADFARAVPTPDHFLPLLYLAGLAAATGSPVDVLLSACTLGSLSMTSFTVGSPA